MQLWVGGYKGGSIFMQSLVGSLGRPEEAGKVAG